MKQICLGGNGFERKAKWTRKPEFSDEMNLVVPWAELVSLIAPHAPTPGAEGGRPPFAVETMLRIHLVQQRFHLSDPADRSTQLDQAQQRVAAGEARMPAPEGGQRAANGGETGYGLVREPGITNR